MRQCWHGVRWRHQGAPYKVGEVSPSHKGSVESWDKAGKVLHEHSDSSEHATSKGGPKQVARGQVPANSQLQ